MTHTLSVIARSTVLPADLTGVLTEVGAKLRQGGSAGAELEAALALLAGLGPGHVARADGEIANAAGLHHHSPRPLASRLLSPRSSDAEQLLQTSGLEYLFLFHRDGRLREAALLKITGGLPSPFLFAAVVWRLNDWAEPVRRAAERCANRSFPATDPSIVAQTAAELLVRQANWSRWRDERLILDQAFGRDDVGTHLAHLIARERTGPQASTLRYALRTSTLDRHLEQIAHEAVQPSVRAVALHALIDGTAKWPSGTAWQWIDKTMGLRRRVTVFDQRPLTVNPSRKTLIACGVEDRSAFVRRVALDGVMKHLPGTAEARSFAARRVADRSPSVRERAEFILRQGAAAQPPSPPR